MDTKGFELVYVGKFRPPDFKKSSTLLKDTVVSLGQPVASGDIGINPGSHALILLRVQQPACCMLIDCEEYLWLVLSIFCCQLLFDTGQKGCQLKSWASLLCVTPLLAKDSYKERWF